jgi:hypothetical protein
MSVDRETREALGLARGAKSHHFVVCQPFVGTNSYAVDFYVEGKHGEELARRRARVLNHQLPTKEDRVIRRNTDRSLFLGKDGQMVVDIVQVSSISIEFLYVRYEVNQPYNKGLVDISKDFQDWDLLINPPIKKLIHGVSEALGGDGMRHPRRQQSRIPLFDF